MPSRKRAKGKARKEKNQVRESVAERDDSQPVDVVIPNVRCIHGSVDFYSQHSSVRRFVDMCQKSLKAGQGRMFGVVELTHDQHREVWENETKRKTVINILSGLGTALFLGDAICTAMDIARVIIMLENYDGADNFCSITQNPSVNEQVLSISAGEEIDIIHFYKQRIPCSCLDEKCSHYEQFQKRGSRCAKCNQKKYYKDLLTCAGCKIVQYCSRECQKLDWPRHKVACKKIQASYTKTVQMFEKMKNSPVPDNK